MAQGRDIYGEQRVSRMILELRAAIDQGDSGGPLILADGTVGGVVFAEARTDDERRLRADPDDPSRARSSRPGPDRSPSQPGACIR